MLEKSLAFLVHDWRDVRRCESIDWRKWRKGRKPSCYKITEGNDTKKLAQQIDYLELKFLGCNERDE